MRKVNPFRVVAGTPEFIMNQDSSNRWEWFIDRAHNNLDGLQLIFNDGTLYFNSSCIPEKDIIKYGDMFRRLSETPRNDGKRQQARYDAIEQRFGEAGSLEAVKVFLYYREYNQEARKQRQEARRREREAVSA